MERARINSVNDSATDRGALIAKLRRALEARPEITFAVLHGSFQTRAHQARDVDVAVWTDSDCRPETGWQRYALDLAAALTVALGTSIDVQVLNDAPVAFRYHALRGEPLLVRDRDFFDDIRARTWDEYFDFLPFARQYLRETLRA